MHDLTGFQRDCLFVVAGNDGAKGLALKRKLEDYGYFDVNHGRLYPNLDTLVDKGFVTKEEVDGRTNAYALTGRGEREIENRREWEAEQVAPRVAEGPVDV